MDSHAKTGDAILLADGAFLQRPERDPHWDLRIYVEAVRPVERAQVVVGNENPASPEIIVRI